MPLRRGLAGRRPAGGRGGGGAGVQLLLDEDGLHGLEEVERVLDVALRVRREDQRQRVHDVDRHLDEQPLPVERRLDVLGDHLALVVRVVLLLVVAPRAQTRAVAVAELLGELLRERARARARRLSPASSSSSSAPSAAGRCGPPSARRRRAGRAPRATPPCRSASAPGGRSPARSAAGPRAEVVRRRVAQLAERRAVAQPEAHRRHRPVGRLVLRAVVHGQNFGGFHRVVDKMRRPSAFGARLERPLRRPRAGQSWPASAPNLTGARLEQPCAGQSWPATSAPHV